MRIKSRKGSVIADSILLIIILFILGITFLIASKLTTEINTDVQSSFTSTEAKAEMAAFNADMPTAYDGVIAVAFGLLWLGAVLSSFLIDTHPAFIVLAVVIALLLLIVPPTIANTYAEFAQDPEINLESQFPATTFIMQHLLLYYFAVVASVIIVQYGKAGG